MGMINIPEVQGMTKNGSDAETLRREAKKYTRAIEKAETNERNEREMTGIWEPEQQDRQNARRAAATKMWDDAEAASYQAGYPFLDRHGVLRNNDEQRSIMSRAVEIYLRGADPDRWGRITGWKTEAPEL